MNTNFESHTLTLTTHSGWPAPSTSTSIFLVFFSLGLPWSSLRVTLCVWMSPKASHIRGVFPVKPWDSGAGSSVGDAGPDRRGVDAILMPAAREDTGQEEAGLRACAIFCPPWRSHLPIRPPLKPADGSLHELWGNHTFLPSLGHWCFSSAVTAVTGITRVAIPARSEVPLRGNDLLDAFAFRVCVCVCVCRRVFPAGSKAGSCVFIRSASVCLSTRKLRPIICRLLWTCVSDSGLWVIV